MGTLLQAKRLIPGVGERRASANAYLGAIAVGGVAGWGVSYVVTEAVTRPSVAKETAKAGAWLVTGVWLVVFLAGIYICYRQTEEGVLASLPMLTWIGVNAVAFVPSSAGTAVGNADLMWAPWYVVFAVGYLVTGVLVTRGWVYLLGAVASVAATVLAFFVLGSVPHSLLLGGLHVVPTAVDAAMGGRELTDEGIPAVERDRLEDGSTDVVST